MPKSVTASYFDFVDAACHELKTPLTSIKIYQELIAKNLNPSDNSEKVTSYLNKLDHNITKLTTLINNFSSLTKLQQHQIHPENSLYSLNDLLQNSLDIDYFIDKTAKNTKLLFNVSTAKQIFNNLCTFFDDVNLTLTASLNSKKLLFLAFYHGQNKHPLTTSKTIQPLRNLDSHINTLYVSALLNCYHGKMALFQTKKPADKLLGYISLPL
jgi:hypothetical protein